MYTGSILMLLSWPVVIFISWIVAKWALDTYEKKAGSKESAD